MSRKVSPVEGQGAFFEMPSVAPTKPEDIDPQSYVVDLPAPATSLADYYTMLHNVVVAIGDVRSRAIGFSKLKETSKPVKEYSYRMETDNDIAQQVVVKSARKSRFKAQDVLNRRNEIEYKQLVRYGHSTGTFTVEEINEHMALPPSIDEIEFKYFTNPEKSAKELLAMRRQLRQRAKTYSKKAADQVA